MYHMPPEVLTGERPGLFGLSLRQLMAALLGLFLSSALADSPLVQGSCALAGVVLARRARGLYAAESLYYLGRWFLVARIWGEDEEKALDPERLYRAAPRDHGGTTYIVRSPAGQVITVKR
jgi:hypothetical protein